MQVAELIERANSHTGNTQLTADALGVSRARVYDWKNGHRPCPAEVQDRLLVLGHASDSEIAAHVIERAGLPPRKSTTAAFVARCAGSLVVALAALAASLGAEPAHAMSRDNV